MVARIYLLLVDYMKTVGSRVRAGQEGMELESVLNFEFWAISKKTFFYRTSLVAASDCSYVEAW